LLIAVYFLPPVSFRLLLFAVGNGAMTAPGYWQRRNELLRDIGNGAMNSSTMAALQKENGEPQFSL